MLRNYGLLTGRLVDHGPQHGGNPHYLLMIDAGGRTYRVAFNLASTEGGPGPQLEYQVMHDLKGGSSGARQLCAKIENRNAFVLRADDASLPSSHP